MGQEQFVTSKRRNASVCCRISINHAHFSVDRQQPFCSELCCRIKVGATARTEAPNHAPPVRQYRVTIKSGGNNGDRMFWRPLN